MTQPKGLLRNGLKDLVGKNGKTPPSPQVVSQQQTKANDLPSGVMKSPAIPDRTTIPHADADGKYQGYIERMGKANRGKAVGGDLHFVISIAKKAADGTYSVDAAFPQLRMEMGPARRSFFDRQGQPIPGVGAGMLLRMKNNVARMPIPGGRPATQGVGIAEETLEWVGAFVGFDHDPVKETGEIRKNSAWQDAQALWEQFQRKREVIVTLKWSSGAAIEFDAGIDFRGFIKDISRVPATEQRVYYRVCLVITNREDMNRFMTGDTPKFLVGGSSNSFEDLVEEQAKHTETSDTPLNETTGDDIEIPVDLQARANHEALIALLVNLAYNRDPNGGLEGFIPVMGGVSSAEATLSIFYNDLQTVRDAYAKNPEYQNSTRFKQLKDLAEAKLKQGSQETLGNPEYEQVVKRK